MNFQEVRHDLMLIISNYGAMIDIPIESEKFFSQLVESFSGTRGELFRYVESNAPKWFRAINAMPAWIHEAEWQFNDGKPMLFVGQVDVPAPRGLFHDDASFYVFFDPGTGETKTVIQVS